MISSSLVKELRHITSAPLMDCKRALEEAKGDLQEAQYILRKKGQSLANKKSTREATEGVIAIEVDLDKKKIAMLQLACETDFVARNEKFQELAKKIVNLILQEGAENLEEKKIADLTVKDYLIEKVAEIRENIVIAQTEQWSWSDNSIVGSYVHHNQKIGTLVELEGKENSDAETVAKEIALHIAANQVKYVSENDIEPSVLEKEKKFLLDKASNSKKPPEVIEKMVTGQIKKFKKEICLLDQPFLKNPEMSVQQYLESKGKNFQIKRFSKFNF